MMTPDNSTSFNVTGLIPATNYTVFLSASTGAGEGNNSSRVIGETPPGSTCIILSHHTVTIYDNIAQQFFRGIGLQCCSWYLSSSY